MQDYLILFQTNKNYNDNMGRKITYPCCVTLLSTETVKYPLPR